jgi:O-antigen/teichoic acid export membrane protein
MDEATPRARRATSVRVLRAPAGVFQRLPAEALTYIVAEAGSRLVTFGTLVVLANLVSPVQFGLTSLYFGLANLASIAFGLGLPNAVVRYFHDPEPFAAVMGSIVALISVTAVVVGVVATVAAGPIAGFLAIPVPLLGACIVAGAAIALRTAWTASLRARRRSRSYAVVLLVEPLIGIAILGLWSRLAPADAITIALSFAAATWLIVAVGLVSLSRDPGLSVRRALARDLATFSGPLIFHAFAMYALGTYDQVIINQTLGTEQAGQYGYAYRWGMAMVALTAAFGAAWGPRFLELVRTDAGRASLDRLAGRSIGALIVAGVLLMIGVPIAASFVTPRELRPALWLTPYVTYGYLWYALYTSVIGYAIAHRRTARVAAGSLSVVALNVGLNYLLVPRYGIAVAAFTTIVAYMALFAIQLWSVRDVAVDIRYGRLAAIVAATGVVPVVVGALL